MLELYFLRHAKSEWNSSEGNDFSRIISEEGVKKTKKIGVFLKSRNFFFDEILCSPSVRTKQTLEIIEYFYSNKPEIKFIDDLYYISGKDLFDILMIEATMKKCLIISHEPLLSNSIESFFKSFENEDFKNAINNFSTSALFSVSFKCEEWHQINKESALINFFIRPYDL
tara:strand:+ start:158 stop:667 length:510 start_codon:yes stop_codon:yes gene_type:complete